MPTIKEVAEELKRLKAHCDLAKHRPIGDDGSIDVRLQVYEDGNWTVHWGDSQYDHDHRGYWGAGYLTPRTNCRNLAKELIEEVEEQWVLDLK